MSCSSRSREVVAVQDDGRCANPGWNPDAMVCDDDGRISKAFRVGNDLPAAFLWSWTGKLLVQRGHVGAVGVAVEAELARLPRVTLGTATTGPDAATLQRVVELLKVQLNQTGKIDVVASVDEQKLLDQVRRESHKAGYADNTACQLGAQVAANSLLKVSIQRTGKEPKLLLQLFSAEKGCLTASGLAPWQADNPERATAVAVADLVQHLRVPAEMPAAAAAAVKQPFGGRKVEDAKEVDVEEVAEAVIDFASTPPAAVFVGDKMVCEKTPCSQAVAHGKATITMSAKDYVTKTEQLTVGPTTRRIEWRLDEDFARLSATCDGVPLAVHVDGKPLGACPVDRARIAIGRHKVALVDRCFLTVEEQFEVKRGESKAIAVAPVARMAALVVRARDTAGNELRGTASLDGKLLGAVPGGFKVPMCARRLVVDSEGNGSWTVDLDLAEGEKRAVRAEFAARDAPAPAERLARGDRRLVAAPDPVPPTDPGLAALAGHPSRTAAVTLLVSGGLVALTSAALGFSSSADRDTLQGQIDTAKATGAWPGARTQVEVQGEIDAINRKIYAAWGLGIAGAAAIGIGWAIWPGTPQASADGVPVVAPWPSGRGAAVAWRF
jgi:hypothetical protein